MDLTTRPQVENRIMLRFSSKFKASRESLKELNLVKEVL